MRHLLLAIGITGFLFSCGKGNHSEKESEINKDSIQQETPVNKIDSMEIKNSTTKKIPLVLETQPVSGNIYQITFFQKNKTIFYYNTKTEKGNIALNGNQYRINKYLFDSKTDSYHFFGNEVTIHASHCKYKENEGEDCGYGKFQTIEIILGKDTLKEKNIDMQDCSQYAD